ncbi:MAG: hypothetical protein ACOCUH_03095, partial [Bacteriovoracia bacterium]
MLDFNIIKNYFFTLSIIIFSFHSTAATPIQIQSLNLKQSCWYKLFAKDNIEIIQIAQFTSSNKTYSTRVSQFANAIIKASKQQIAKAGFKVNVQGKYEVFLHCYTSGNNVVVNFANSKPPFIYLTTLENIYKGKLAANISENEESSFTPGVDPLSINIEIKPNISQIHFKKVFKGH